MRVRSFRVWAAAAGFACVALGCASSFAAGRSADPPLLVPWSRIGDLSLGEPKLKVEREYGTVGHGYHVIAQQGDFVQGYYILHGGQVGVTFEAGRVEDISFSVRYYRTANGLGIGSTIPLGACVRTWTHRCGHVWHGFVWNEYYREQPCGCWTKVGTKNRSLRPVGTNFLKPWTFIYIYKGHIDGFRFTTKFVD